LGASGSERLAFYLLKEVTRAIGEFDLIAEGDRVAVAVSGGKDSRALLQLLLRHRRKAPYGYNLLALHIVGTAAGFPDRSAERSRRSLRAKLEPWFRELGVDYHFAPLELRPDEPLPLIASAAPGTSARRSSPPRPGWAAANWLLTTTVTARPARHC